MKVLFINPRYFEENYRYKVNKLSPPLGMAILSGMLRMKDHGVMILDLEAMKTNLSEQLHSIKEFGPDITGIFGTSPVKRHIKESILFIRQNFPESIIIVGGPHATLFPDDFLQGENHVDYVLRGEAEYSLVEFVNQIEAYHAVKFPDRIEGLAFNDGGQIYRHPVIPRIDNLDDLPFPSYDLLPMERYFETGCAGKVITMMTSRGCPNCCIYCADPVLYGHKFRGRSAGSVVEEIKYLNKAHNIDHIVFYDANFNADRERVSQICRRLIEEKLNVTWRARVRADNIDRESVRLMKDAGCTELSVGVESGSERILKILKKKEDKNEIRNAFDIIKGFDLWLVGYFMFGIPGETPSDAEETIQFALELDPDWALFSVATPMPGTEFLEIVKASGCLISHDLNNYKANFDTPVISYPYFTGSQIKSYVNMAYEKFYLRKEWLLNRLNKSKNDSQILNVINSYKYYSDKLHTDRSIA